MNIVSLLSLRRLAFIAIAAIAARAPAQVAPSLTLDPVAQNIAVGDTAFVNLNVSGLGDGVSPSLGGWLVNITFNQTVVSISAAGVTFGPELDLGVFGSMQSVDTATAGVLKLDEVSFEDGAALNAAQPGTFTLAMLEFVGLTPGTSILGFSRAELSDELGFPLTVTSTGASITVGGGNGVPDTGATTLLAALCLGLLCVASSRRSRRSSQV